MAGKLADRGHMHSGAPTRAADGGARLGESLESRKRATSSGDGDTLDQVLLIDVDLATARTRVWIGAGSMKGAERKAEAK